MSFIPRISRTKMASCIRQFSVSCRSLQSESGDKGCGISNKQADILRQKTPVGKFYKCYNLPALINYFFSGKLEEQPNIHPAQEKNPLPEFPDGVNPKTGEIGGPKGPEPTRYGDWERKGRVTDF